MSVLLTIVLTLFGSVMANAITLDWGRSQLASASSRYSNGWSSENHSRHGSRPNHSYQNTYNTAICAVYRPTPCVPLNVNHCVTPQCYTVPISNSHGWSNDRSWNNDRAWSNDRSWNNPHCYVPCRPRDCDPPQQIPEPSGVILLAFAASGLLLRRQRA